MRAAWHCVWLVLAFAMPARAHDPGLSSLTIRPRPGGLAVGLQFAPADLPAAGAAGARALAGGLVVRLGGQTAPAILRAVRREQDGDVELELEVAGDPCAGLELRANYLQSLPRAHKQFVQVLGHRGEVVASALLDRAHPEFGCGPLDLPQASFVLLGVEHVLTGFDHLAFLLVLLAASKTLGAVLRVVTAFTVAHSLTLAAATLGVLRLPGPLVESVIALSIVFVAIQSLRGSARHRLLTTFSFGLVHGLGFASVLAGLGLGDRVAWSLLEFNAGVELGQVAFALVALPVVTRLPRATAWLALLAGAWWAGERLLG
jgi:hydrogenase/urease accessory protein HupE